VATPTQGCSIHRPYGLLNISHAFCQPLWLRTFRGANETREELRTSLSCCRVSVDLKVHWLKRYRVAARWRTVEPPCVT